MAHSSNCSYERQVLLTDEAYEALHTAEFRAYCLPIDSTANKLTRGASIEFFKKSDVNQYIFSEPKLRFTVAQASEPLPYDHAEQKRQSVDSIVDAFTAWQQSESQQSLPYIVLSLRRTNG